MSFESSEAFGSLLAAGIGVLVVLLLVVVAWAVFYFIGMWKMYVKAGKEGWKCLIPFYNSYVLTAEIAGLNWWWFLIYLAPTILGLVTSNSTLSLVATLAEIFAGVNIYYNLSKRFNKSTGWIVLTVFFGFITLPLLGYSEKEKYENVDVNPNGFIG